MSKTTAAKASRQYPLGAVAKSHADFPGTMFRLGCPYCHPEPWCFCISRTGQPLRGNVHRDQMKSHFLRSWPDDIFERIENCRAKRKPLQEGESDYMRRVRGEQAPLFTVRQ